MALQPSRPCCAGCPKEMQGQRIDLLALFSLGRITPQPSAKDTKSVSWSS